MKISVVIPAYNEEKYLSKTLESIAKLDRKPDEIIVIDGSSTDKTIQVARDGGARVITVEHRGIGFARQKGLEAAGGDIVAFTDADTVVPKDWLIKIVAKLSQPNVAGVYGGFRLSDGPFFYRFYINFIQPCIIAFFHRIGMPLAPGQNSAFWKKAGLAAGGYPEDFKIAEDIEMARRLLTVGEVGYLAQCAVMSSGRRGNEGISFLFRVSKAFLYYFITRKADKIGFPDIR